MRGNSSKLIIQRCWEDFWEDQVDFMWTLNRENVSKCFRCSYSVPITNHVKLFSHFCLKFHEIQVFWTLRIERPRAKTKWILFRDISSNLSLLSLASSSLFFININEKWKKNEKKSSANSKNFPNNFLTHSWIMCLSLSSRVVFLLLLLILLPKSSFIY